MLDDLQQSLYAVLDGASVPNLPQELYQHEPDFLCLYRGALDPDLAETAPYLVRLEPGTPFTEWVLNEGWGNHWGIFLTASCEMRDLRSHFRKFLIVYDAAGKPLYFRYYDPRVMRAFLPTCNATELQTVIGPIESYFVESEDSAKCLRFRRDENGLVQETLPVEGSALSAAASTTAAM
jgi:hypothetical protein